MERLLQYLDDVDDLVGLLGLSYESIRRFALRLVALVAGVLALSAGFLLALSYPSPALGIGLLLLIFLGYRTLAGMPRRPLHSA